MEGVVRCKGCGSWLMATFTDCDICSKIGYDHRKGTANAELNQRGQNMLGAREASKGAL